ncbi:unnamed protein product [Cuscuta campestris]|uniref:Uncharacterized protein n=1 Tax=Cuscuta campestris TaxID=132261 RepID=A0A484N270_9ASTE|nr:unnamed protein product [Cuscuta campestris]
MAAVPRIFRCPFSTADLFDSAFQFSRPSIPDKNQRSGRGQPLRHARLECLFDFQALHGCEVVPHCQSDRFASARWVVEVK